MRTSSCLLVCVLLGLASAATAAEKLSVLFLGDQGHHKPAARFADCKAPLAERGITVTYTDNLNDLSAATLGKYDVLLVYANIAKVSPEQEQAVLDYVAGGKGFVPVHCASACFGGNPALVQLMGGRFKSHGTATFRALITNREHPTMKGFGGFDTWDETYVHDQHNEQDRTVLMERSENGKREAWTWTRTHGKGRVFYTASGHDERTWTAPGFQDLLARGIAWAAGSTGNAMLADLLGPFAKDKRAPLTYEERPTVQNYEKRSPAPQYQLPLSPKDSQDYTLSEYGFEVKLFAAEPDVVKPIAFTWDHRGRLWVAESVDYPSKYTELWQGNDRIKICEDTDGDGKADKFTVFCDKLNIPTGLVFANGGLIVAQAPQFLFLKDTNGDDQADVKEVLMEGWSKGDTHAGPSNLHYGFDNRIYGAVGYSGWSGKVDGRDVRFSSGLWRMEKSGAKIEFLSQYNNNTWGFSFNEAGELFGSTANNTQHCYTPIPIPFLDATAGLMSDDNRKAVRMDQQYNANPLTEKIRQVDIFGGYTAAAGANLYTARNYPAWYWNSVTLLTEPTMHLLHQGKLVRDGSGWTEGVDGSNLIASADEWFAPVHAEVGPNGAVWVADWYNFIIQHNPTPRKEHGGFDSKTGKGGAHENALRDYERGRIYQVVWKGAKPARRSVDPAKPDDLLAALKDDNLFWRRTAQRLLVERGKTDVVPQLIAAAKDQSVDALGLNGGVVHALWTLHGLGALDGKNQEALDAAIAALKHPAHGVRRNAVQVLPPVPASSAGVFHSGILKDKDPNVRLAAFLAVSSLPTDAGVGMTLFAQSQDPETRGDRNLPTALQVGAAQHGGGYLVSAINSGMKVPVLDAGENNAGGLIANPGFETATGDAPSGWERRTYNGKGDLTRAEGGRTGFCVQISSTEGADVGWMISLPVKPRTKYRATAWIKTKDLKGATGALLNLNSHPAKSKAVTGTKDWTRVTMDFDSENRDRVEMNCLYGGWGQSTGTAWWDDVSVIELGQGGLPGQTERLVARNFAARHEVDEQLGLMNVAAKVDPGLAAAIFAGFADGWNDREVPKDLSAKQKSELAAIAAKVPAPAQASANAIVARWSAGGGAVVKAAANAPKLPPDELKRFESGRNRYSTLCIACHQANGQGLPGLAPSLVKSEWVQGPASRPVRIVLHGLQGPITVNGALFTSPLVMPPQKDVLDDVAISEVLTYVRNEWGNVAAPVQPADVKAIREADATRTQPWTAEELMKLK